jgi:hypothetical protein
MCAGVIHIMKDSQDIRFIGLTLREERKLQAFGNKVLWKIFGTKQDVLSWQFRIKHNKELRDLYRSPSTVSGSEMSRLLMTWICKLDGKCLLRKPVGKQPFGRPRWG